MVVHKTKSIYLISVMMILAAAANYSCRQSKTTDDPSSLTERPKFLNNDPNVAYVGDEVCASCHAKISRSFKKNGMGRSLYPLTAANRIENIEQDNEIIDPGSQMHYRFVKRGEKFYQNEFRLDTKGKRIHDLERKIDYVVGSGNHARTYLTEENGYLYEMPMTWYTQKKQWGLSPGYEQFNYRFSRPINSSCMNCHNSYPDFVPYSGNRFTRVPYGIGCERCHGPGQLHVEKRSDGEDTSGTASGKDITIVNPRHLPADYQIDVCLQCHLQGVVGISKTTSQMNKYRPGMRLTDIRSVYVSENPSPNDLRVASHGERTMLSACYQKSNGAFGCITCHDPHLPLEKVPKEQFNKKCLQCHSVVQLSQERNENRHTEHSDCISCHMPKSTTTDVVHANFTEHWIQKKPQREQVNQSSAPAGLRDFFSENDKDAKLRIELARLQYYEAIPNGKDLIDGTISTIKDLLHKNNGNEGYGEALYRLGLIKLEKGSLNDAAEQFRRLTQIEPNNAQAHVQLAVTLEKLSKNDEAIASYRSSLKIIPENAAALTQLGNLLLQKGNTEEALHSLTTAITVQPSYVQAYTALGNYYMYRREDLRTARSYLSKALVLDPDNIAVLSNLGILEMAFSRYTLSESYFIRVIAGDPGNVSAYGNLALIYAAQNRRSETVNILKKGLQLDPANGRMREMLKKVERGEKI